ncbi:MAG: hypothetical protein ACJAXK_003255 [Yoonia sp.]|jgi:hypothetical protein
MKTARTPAERKSVETGFPFSINALASSHMIFIIFWISDDLSRMTFLNMIPPEQYR